MDFRKIPRENLNLMSLSSTLTVCETAESSIPWLMKDQETGVNPAPKRLVQFHTRVTGMIRGSRCYFDSNISNAWLAEIPLTISHNGY